MLALTRFTPKLDPLELLLISTIIQNLTVISWKLRMLDCERTNQQTDRSDCMPLPSCGENNLLENQVFTIFKIRLQHWSHVCLMGTFSEVQRVHKVLISHLKSESATKHRNDPFRPNAMKRVCSAFTSCTDMKCYTVICMQVTILSWRCTKSPGLHTEWN